MTRPSDQFSLSLMPLKTHSPRFLPYAIIKIDFLSEDALCFSFLSLLQFVLAPCSRGCFPVALVPTRLREQGLFRGILPHLADFSGELGDRYMCVECVFKMLPFQEYLHLARHSLEKDYPNG